MDRQLPTIGQLERSLSQSIQKLYREELEHSAEKVICKFFDNHLSIVIEEALTAVEQTLADKNVADKAVKNLNLAIEDILKVKFKTTVESVLKIEVVDVLFDCNPETRRAGAIVVLNRLPEVRYPKSSPKIIGNK